MAVDGQREVLTWAGYGAGVRELAGLVAADGFRADVVLAIARGGLLVAGSLAYALSVKNCSCINVEFYTGVDERLAVPVILPPHLDLLDGEFSRVLLVDDVADTGSTLALVAGDLVTEGREVRTAVLYAKPRSVIVPDYAWRRTDRWIEFPWSSEPPVVPAAARPGLAQPGTG